MTRAMTRILQRLTRDGFGYITIPEKHRPSMRALETLLACGILEKIDGASEPRFIAVRLGHKRDQGT